MHTRSMVAWGHRYTFGQERPHAGERRTLLVLLLTAAAMAVEIAAGPAFDSAALLADGLHMGKRLRESAFAGQAGARVVLTGRFQGSRSATRETGWSAMWSSTSRR